MTRAGLWAIGIGVIVSAGSLAVEQGYAGDHEGKCTLATLKGQYLFATTGMVFPPAFGVTKRMVSNAAGYEIYNGDGTGEDFVTFTVNGVNLNVQSPQPTTYTLNSDCTGTRTVHPSGLPPGPHFNIFVALDGEGLTEIATDQGFAVSSSARRAGSE